MENHMDGWLVRQVQEGSTMDVTRAVEKSLSDGALAAWSWMDTGFPMMHMQMPNHTSQYWKGPHIRITTHGERPVRTENRTFALLEERRNPERSRRTDRCRVWDHEFAT